MGIRCSSLNHPKPLFHEHILPPGCWRYHSERFAANIQLRLFGFMWATCESLITWEYLWFFTKGGGVNHLKKKVRWRNFWCQSYVIHDVIIYGNCMIPNWSCAFQFWHSEQRPQRNTPSWIIYDELSCFFVFFSGFLKFAKSSMIHPFGRQ